MAFRLATPADRDARVCHETSTRISQWSYVAGQMKKMLPLIFESCHATWLFDTETMRFCRVLRGIEVDGRRVATRWRPFYGVEFEAESEAFTVLLNSRRTKLIRSWRHTDDCTQCGGHITTELSLEDIRAALV
jgi:hypothetical protein